MADVEIVEINEIEQIDEESQDTRELGPIDLVNKLLGFAKLDKDDVQPMIQSLYFSPQLDNDHYRFLELDEDLIGRIKTGERLFIKGEKSESAVLCTNDKTFDVKDADTSNSLLLLPACSFGEEKDEGEQHIMDREVISVLRKYLELKLCKPRLKKLRDLLEQNPYLGRLEERDNEMKKYTYDDVLDVVQASEEEIKTGLKEAHACIIDGYVRILDHEFLSKVITSIEDLISENSWSLDHVSLNECCDTLETLYHRDVIKSVLNTYGEPVQTDTDAGDVYRISEEMISRYYATLLLKNTGKFNLKEFLSTWQESVPDGMHVDLSMLKGLALIDRSTKPEVVWYFPSSGVPEETNERFNFLFKVKEKWSLDEITPYIQDLTTDKLSVNGLLTKFCRASTQGGVKVYNSRRPVS